MSHTMTATVGGPGASYTVEHRGQCMLIAGAVPIGAFAALAGLAPAGSVLDANLARMLGVNLAFGPPDELQALRASATPAAEARTRAKHPNASPALTRWLGLGERGVSSNTIVQTLTGIPALGDWTPSHPHDADDFRRCRLLLEQVPELVPLLPRMADASTQWSRLVNGWDVICDAMDAEAPSWREDLGRTPRTNDLIYTATR
jgi:hypothetical protein